MAENSAAKDSFYIVGIGASAGGVQALKEFFENTPPDSGMAYVVILHLSPDHDSHLTSLLQTVTDMTVQQVKEKVKVQPNHVYVVPPNQHLMMEDGMLTVSVNTAVEERRAPVDIFFRTLAESHKFKAIAVILSGTGANGSMGMKRIKEKGGAVFVQNPREAEFSEMPRNSIATELVDEVLPVADIPLKILSYIQSQAAVHIPIEATHQPQEQQQALREIFTQLRLRTGHDFSNYKRPTLLRRIERRINIHNLPDLPAYTAYLVQHPDEINSLLKDLLISVTNFFRDKKAFEELENTVLPLIFQGKSSVDNVRIWVAGCATGEEAYSLAILCAERTINVLDTPKVQIFATDIDDAAIATAREGLYTLNDAADVSPERLRRFFTREGDDYRIRREIREMVLFANHNFLKDPPFSHLDLITCRNVLIYLNHTAQERVMETFHFALNPAGFLFLGTSESTDTATDLYSHFSREHHIFQSRLATNRTYPLPESVPSFRQHEAPAATPDTPEAATRNLDRITYGDLHQRLLEQYAPPSMVVNEEYDIVHLSERAGRYLQIAGGELSRNLLKLVKQELRLELRSALYQATQRQSPIVVQGLQAGMDDGTETLNIEVRPVLQGDEATKGFILIIFTPAGAGTKENIIYSSEEPVARHLEEELVRLKAQLRTSNEQHEFQAEELKAANEELQAMNEELRSAAEELETSKEELQSINEELTTVNQELKVKVDEVSMSGNNLQNLINSTDLGTIFLDRSFRVVLFTPSTRSIFNLIQADIGRPLSDITSKLDYNDISADAELVLDKLQAIEQEVMSLDGRTYLMRILPYRTVEDHIQGVVITFINITERRQAEEVLRQAEEKYRTQLKQDVADRTAELKESQYQYKSLVENTPDIIIRWDKHLRLQFANSAHEERTGVPFSAALGKTKEEMSQPADVTGPYTDKLRQVFATGKPLEHLSVLLTPQGELPLLVRMVPEQNEKGEVATVLAIGRDISELKNAQQEVIAVKEELARKATDKYQTLFNSIDEGFCIIEVLFDEKEVANDYRFLEVNPAFERQTGLVDAVGKTMKAMAPAHEAYWFDIYGAVALTGKPIRFKNEAKALGIYYDVYAFRYGRPQDHQVGILFRDITKRKRQESQQAFLAEVSQDLLRMTKPEEALEIVGEKIGTHFNSIRTSFVEILEKEDKAMVREWHQPELPDIGGEYPLSQFLGEPYRKKSRAGETIVIPDAHQSSLVDGKQLEAVFGVVSFINVPLVREGQWVFTMGIHDAVPRTWRDDEVELLQELTARIWTRLEKVRAEEALQKSEEKYRTLFNSIDEGVATLELIFDDEGVARDFVYLEHNPALTRLTGLTNDISGKRVTEVLPDIEPFWLETFEKVIKTGEPVRVEHFTKGLNKWFDVFASRIEGGNSHKVVVVYSNITERKKIEQAISNSEKRKTFLLQLSDMLATLSNAADVQEAVTHGVMNYLTANRCYYCQIDSGTVLIQRDAHQPGLSSVAGMYDLNTLPVFKPFFQAGEQLIVSDVHDTDMLDAGLKQLCIGQQIISFINLPVIKNNELVGRFCITEATARIWTEWELELAKEIAERTWAAVERANVEDLLRRREAELAQAQEIGHIGGVNIEVARGLVSRRSPEYIKLHGLPPDTEFESHDDWLQRVHPDDRAKASQTLQDALAGNASGYENEYRIIRPSDGQVRWIYAKIDVERNAEGQPVRLIGIHIDITERKQTEEALRISEERFRTVLQSADMGAWDWNIVDDVTIWNKEHYTMLGADPSHQPMDSAYFLHFIYPEDKERVVNTLYEAVSTEGVYHAEFRITRDDTGEVRWMSGYGRVAAMQNGQATRMVGVMSDITERKMLEQQREDFLGFASHELKTPVTSIKAYAQILLNMFEASDDTHSAALMQKLDNQVTRLTSLISDLLDVTKIAEGQLPLHLEAFDVNELLQERAEDLQRLSARHRLVMELCNKAVFTADRERIGQVITNFVSNAIKYSPLANEVIIRCQYRESELQISVQDFGIGIPKDVQRKVFDRFFRVKETQIQNFPGLGLGLFISAGIIHRHGGKIWVESKPGEGSTFYFTLPVGK